MTQAADGSGCWSDAPIAGCTTGRELGAPDDVAISRDGRSVYTTNTGSASVAAFRLRDGSLSQLPGSAGCLVDPAPAGVGCRYLRQLPQPEGVAISRDGHTVYAVSSAREGAVITLNRNPGSGAVVQKPGSSGCVTGGTGKDCRFARALHGVTSVVVSPDGRSVYAAASKSDAVVVFKRK